MSEIKKKIVKKKAVKTEPKPHTHNYRKGGLSIWCACGDMRHITCAHNWKFDRQDSISFDKMGGSVSQRQEIRICTRCGAIANMNTTTGETKIRHD